MPKPTEAEHLRERLRAALACLDRRERAIVVARSRGATLEQLAPKFGVTRERIRQLEKRAIEKVRAAMTAKPPRKPLPIVKALPPPKPSRRLPTKPPGAGAAISWVKDDAGHWQEAAWR